MFNVRCNVTCLHIHAVDIHVVKLCSLSMTYCLHVPESTREPKDVYGIFPLQSMDLSGYSYIVYIYIYNNIYIVQCSLTYSCYSTCGLLCSIFYRQRGVGRKYPLTLSMRYVPAGIPLILLLVIVQMQFNGVKRS